MRKLNNSNNLISTTENHHPRRNFSWQRIISLLSIAAILMGGVLIFSSVFGFFAPDSCNCALWGYCRSSRGRCVKGTQLGEYDGHKTYL